MEQQDKRHMETGTTTGGKKRIPKVNPLHVSFSILLLIKFKILVNLEVTYSYNTYKYMYDMYECGENCVRPAAVRQQTIPGRHKVLFTILIEYLNFH